MYKEKNRNKRIKIDYISDHNIFKKKIFEILNKEIDYNKQHFHKLIADEYNKQNYIFQ